MLVERLSAVLDGDLSAAECARIKRHARSCARCARLTEELQQTAGACQRAAKTPLPASLRAKARASIAALLAQKPR